MTEINELVAPPEPHSPGSDEDCPFCPEPEPEKFTTHPGSANDSSVLENVMADPGCLAGKQGGARPKDGSDQRQRASQAKPKPDPIFRNNKWGAYSAEAHHLISGNQALKGHDIEKWIVGGDLIKKDTGYSVNNSDNGEWLPSIPEGHKGGAWSPLSFDDKLDIAAAPMKRGKGQFHKGPHNVVDKDGLVAEHTSYPKEVKRLLSDLVEVMHGWAAACPICKKVDPDKGPFDPNWRVHDMLDSLSRGIGVDLKGPPGHWYYFISKVALEFHRTVCEHTTL
jgi:hypothetical protein